jgi:hypothetical protein
MSDVVWGCLLAGQLTLDQLVEVRILCPQPNIYGIASQIPPYVVHKEPTQQVGSLFYCNPV